MSFFLLFSLQSKLYFLSSQRVSTIPYVHMCTGALVSRNQPLVYFLGSCPTWFYCCFNLRISYLSTRRYHSHPALFLFESQTLNWDPGCTNFAKLAGQKPQESPCFPVLGCLTLGECRRGSSSPLAGSQFAS